MRSFIIKEYLVYVTNKITDERMYFILKKDSLDNITIIQVKKNKKAVVYSIKEIEEIEVRELIGDLSVLLKVKGLKSSSSQLLKILSRKKSPSIIEYGNTREIKKISKGAYDFRIVEYYYDAKGRLFDKTIGEYSETKVS